MQPRAVRAWDRTVWVASFFREAMKPTCGGFGGYARGAEEASEREV
jgi:hypothetical protein